VGGGQKVDVIVTVCTGCAVSASVDEAMELGVAGKQLINTADASDRIKIVIRFIRYPL
jgi:hypothetical protein